MNRKNRIWKRITALALAAVLLAGVLPAAIPEAEAAEWMEPYLNQIVDWGVMRGNAAGDLNPDQQITRAEFVTLVNRAFGYTEVGPNPFTDVPDGAWYAEDICIAHKAGYFNGTSATTASPRALVTREQAAVLIGRNLRLQGGGGLNSDFTDSRQMGAWSRGLVQEAADLGIIQGYADGAFRPKASITRGQVACFLVRALGSLIHEPGEYNNMNVYGNLTVNTPGVTLRNALITGNLYLTGGVGLGDLVLENVEVQGKIIIAGGGEAQAGENSIVLRNVRASVMEVDSMTDQFITLRAEGLTNIGDTNVRTQAYLEDVTADGLGLKKITFDAASGSRLDLAGNIKEFVNLTPESTINLAQGIIQKVTIDEKAANATVNIDATTSVKEINLDVGSTITGSGDIEHMNVDASGTTSAILPDTIFVRPGINSNIGGQQMDSAAAAESSEDPRLLTGYPAVRNVASRSATAVFSTNKPGTLYWGLSALADGSLGEEDLTTTSTTTNGKVIRKGTVNVSAGKTEVTAALSGLSIDGSYYVSALLQDNRGQRSAVKVTAFVTPDDTTPAFGTGYPTANLAENDDGEQIIQARVMANKTCRLYYALMPNNSTAPTAADFKANSLSGNLGYGVVDLRKNVPWLIPQVNSAHLREETDYDLYLWLCDVDGARSSAVRKIDIRTLDKTPPVILDLESGDATATSVSMRVTLNEPGTLYWAVVKEGAQFYRQDASETDPLPNTETAKMQIETGLGALRKGSVNVGQADTPVNFNVSGLAAQTGYDLYFVAKDRSGNYCVFPSDNPKDDLVPPMQIRTLDNQAPTVKQEFTHDGSSGNALTPYADTSIRLVFSERVKGVRDVNGKSETSNFLELYQDVQAAMEAGRGEREARDLLAARLANHISLYRMSNRGPVKPDPWVSANEDDGDSKETTTRDWLVDFRQAVVEMDPSGTGEMFITIPYNSEKVDSGLNLAGGTTYYITLTGIQDMVGNQMQGNRGVTTLPQFTTLFATVNLGIADTMVIGDTETVVDKDGNTVTIPTGGIRVDLSFSMLPSATESVSDDAKWDLLLWTDKTMAYTLYSRTRSGENSPWSSWKEEGSITTNVAGQPGGRVYASLMNHPNLRNHNSIFEQLNELTDEVEFAIHVDSINSDPNYTAWNETVTMSATVLSGSNSALRQSGLQTLGNSNNLNNATSAGAVSIGVPDPFDMRIPFTDSQAPEFLGTYPQVEAGDISATLRVTIDRPGTVYYVAAPVTKTGTDPTVGINYTCPVEPQISASSGTSTVKPELEKITEIEVKENEADKEREGLEVVQPYVTTVTGGVQGTSGVISGDSSKGGTIQAGIMREIQIEGLTPNTTYILYLVTQGVSPIYSDNVLAYQFTTVDAVLPKIDITRNGNANATISVDRSSYISYALVPTNSLTTDRGSPFAEEFKDDKVNSLWGTEGKAKYPDVETVLDAMLTGCYNGRTYLGSVFDIYGNEQVKSTYADLISQTASGGVTDVAMTARDELVSVGTAAGSVGRLPLNPMTGMQGNDWYTLLVVGHTVNSSGNAFRASRSYFNTSQNFLTVTNCDLSATTDTGTANTTPTCSGTLRINFSDSLHYRVRDLSTGKDTRYPLDTCPLNDSKHTGSNNLSTNNYINIGSVMNIMPAGTGTITLTNNTGHDKPIGQMLAFKVDKVRSGSTIFFQMNLCGASHNVRENTTLTVKINYTPPAPGSAPGTEGVWTADVSPISWMS